MALTPAEIANAPKITLGGVEFPIPTLALKQNRVVVGGLKKLLPMLAALDTAAVQGKKALAEASGKPENDSGIQNAGMAMLEAVPVDDASFTILCDVVYAALGRAHPQLTRDEFEEMTITPVELMIAVPVIMAQSFAFAKKEPDAGESKPETPAPQTAA